MTEDERQNATDELRQVIARDVAAGFTPLDEIAGNAIEYLGDDHDPDELRPIAVEMFHDVIARQRAEQKCWPTVTDFDRLQRAFDRLEASGIVCRHNFSCCGSCASGEIWDEIHAEEEGGRKIRGAAHYDMQGTEAAVEHGSFCFSYTSAEPWSEKASVAIARELAAALEHEGLKTDWDGTYQKRVCVELDWKRRLPPA